MSVAMQSSQPTVFVVDDDEAVRSSLKLLLRSVGRTVVDYASAGAYLAAYRYERAGCLILDLRMPGMSGLELQDQLNARGAIVPVIFISGHANVPMAVEAMQHGAFDFLQKPLRDQNLLERVQAAIALDTANRKELTQFQALRQRLDSLTAREHEVWDLVTQGKANKAMAADLHMSQRTVEIHRARVMEKMRANSLAQLVRMMIELEDSKSA